MLHDSNQTFLPPSDRMAKARAARKLGAPRKTPVEKWEASNKKSFKLLVEAKCWDCCLGDKESITECAVTGCPLHCVRPYQKGN